MTLSGYFSQSWTWIGFIHGLGWIGLDWVQFLLEKMDWIGLEVFFDKFLT